MSGTVYHLRLDLRGVLANHERQLLRSLRTPDGRRMTLSAARSALVDLVASGVLYLPVGSCDRWSDTAGCLGHPVAESAGDGERIRKNSEDGAE